MSDLNDQSVSLDGSSPVITQNNNKHDDSITTNVSTEVQLDTTIIDRLESLHVDGDDNSGSESHTQSNNHSDTSESTPKNKEDTELTRDGEKATINNTTVTTIHTSNALAPTKEPVKLSESSQQQTEKIAVSTTPLKKADESVATVSASEDDDDDDEDDDNDDDELASGQARQTKSADLQRSILAGEISDDSECSVDVDDVDEKEPQSEEKANSNHVSDEEMFIEDNDDEDVEEEEEFHEFEEEQRHKTSQESVQDDKAAPKTISDAASKLSDASAGDKSSRVDPKEDLVSQKDNNGSQEKISSSEKTNEDPNASISITNSAKSNQISVAASEPPNKGSDWAEIMCSTVGGKQTEAKPVEPETVKTSEEGDKPDDIGKNAELESQEKVDETEKKELDLDEDVKNPQYIPKKGIFYEHDDRSHDSEAQKAPSTSVKKDDENVDAKDSGVKKAPAQDKQNDNRRGNRRQRADQDRWNHDLFRDEKQKPKSKNELINSYGYDIRQERSGRNQTDTRNQRGGNNNNADRQQGGPDLQRSRPSRDNRTVRQGAPSNRSRERRPRRQQNNRNRTDTSLGTPAKRDVQNTSNRSSTSKTDSKPEPKLEVNGGQQVITSATTQPQLSGFQQPLRREANHDLQSRDRNARNDRNRRQNSKDRPNTNKVDESKLPPINTVMPPITTWSNEIEDMVKEEAKNKASTARYQIQPSIDNSSPKGRANDHWPTNSSKGTYQDRPTRNMDDGRSQQHYNPRRFQDREEPLRHNQFVNRNHHNDRSNQHGGEWRRTNNYNSYAKVNEPIKTQTFENSRLSQNNMNRTVLRDGRDIINERRMQNQHNYQSKIQGNSVDPQLQQRQLQHHQHLQQLMQQQQQQPHQQHSHQMNQHHNHHHHQHHQQHQMQLQHQPHQANLHPRQQQQQHQQPASTSQQQQSASGQPSQQASASQVGPQMQGSSRHSQQTSQQQQQPPPSQQNRSTGAVINSVSQDGAQDVSRMASATSTAAANELLNSRPIVKTDAYTGTNVGPQSQQPPQAPMQQQHSQNHRSLGGGPLAQQGPTPVTSHLVPSHIGTQAQYYTPPGSSRDSTSAAEAMVDAYHGYMPGGHSVMDTSRYHMTSQQLSDHGYMPTPGQVNHVAGPNALHQSVLYPDAASAGGTVASSAYLAQAGSTMSPSTNIPVTGAGPPPPLPPVSYLQHSQYAPPPPYSNPYSQPQHNQAPPPQSSHAYPYWTYI